MKKQHYQKGFGLIEVLLASLVIITVIMALIYVGRLAISNSSEAQRRTQATYLAQEAMESVRQIRDSNYIDNDVATSWAKWLRGLDTSKTYFINSSGSAGGVILTEQARAGEYNVGNNSFLVAINFHDLEDTNMLLNPFIDSSNMSLEHNKKVRDNKAIIVKVRATWDGGEVRLSGLLADSRQGF